MGSSAVIKVLALALALAAFAATGSRATAQVPDPTSTVGAVVQDVTTSAGGDPVDDVVDTASDTVTAAGDLITGGASPGGAGGSGGGSGGSSASGAGSTTSTADSLVGSIAGTAGSATAGGRSTFSGTSSSATTGDSGASSHIGAGRPTAFDRLPTRYERLLERIASGENVRANIRRLEQSLGSASPELRRRILRAVRKEIARMKKDGLTRAERRSVARLQHAVRVIRRERSSADRPATTSGGLSGVRASAVAGRTASGTATGGAVLAATAAEARREAARPTHQATDRNQGGAAGNGIVALPGGGTALAVGIYLALALLFLVTVVSFGLAAAPLRTVPAGRLREFVQWSRTDLVTTGLATAAGLALLLFYGALF